VYILYNTDYKKQNTNLEQLQEPLYKSLAKILI
jgi:hypothetical protein